MAFGNQYPKITFDDISETMSEDVLSFLDLPGVRAKYPWQRQWQEEGVVHLPRILSDELIENYCAVREKLNSPGGWKSETPYLHVKELRDICLHIPLISVMKDLVGGQVGLHLNLTGWVSTERNWHQDSYLNPEFVGTNYAAVWMALDDISPDSGPFQYAPGSHKWKSITRRKIFKYLNAEEQKNPAWPSLTQNWVARACEEELLEQKAEVVTYLPKKGDALIWHSNLIHRGSRARVPGMQRKSLIGHYSALSARKDMPERRQHDNGRWFFWFDHELK